MLLDFIRPVAQVLGCFSWLSFCLFVCFPPVNKCKHDFPNLKKLLHEKVLTTERSSIHELCKSLKSEQKIETGQKECLSE